MNLNTVNDTMDEAMDDFARALEKIKHCLVAYKRECQCLIDEINKSSRFEAEEKFDKLFEASGRISRAWFVLGVELEPDLKILARQFERLHEPHTREYWYKRFKAGERWPS